jgi:hypothetical protein
MENTSLKQYNNHNVRIKFGRASEEQLRNCLNGFLQLLSKKFPEKNYNKCQIDMNMVYTMDRETGQLKSTGSGFLWVENPEVYYIMCGFNPDGTDRYESVRSSPLQGDTSSRFLDMSFLEILDYDMSSGPEIRVQLPPIAEIPCYKRSEEDKEEAYQYALSAYIRECNGQGIEPTPDHESLRHDASYGYIRTSRAETHSIQDDRQVTNKLRGVVAGWVTKAELERRFEKFNSTSNHDGNDKLKVKVEFNPEPRKDEGHIEKREVIITYNRRFDGCFALQMHRRSYFMNPKTKKQEMFIFDFYKNFKQEVITDSREHRGSHEGYDRKKKTNFGNNSFLNRNMDNGFANRSQASTPTTSNDGFQTARRAR